MHLWPCRPHPRSAEELNTPHHWTWKTNACSSRCSYRSEVRHSRRHEGWWLMTIFWSYIAVVFFEERITWKTAISNTDFSCEFILRSPASPQPPMRRTFLGMWKWRAIVSMSESHRIYPECNSTIHQAYFLEKLISYHCVLKSKVKGAILVRVYRSLLLLLIIIASVVKNVRK